MEQNQRTRRNAQNLRKNMTKEERHLWYDFLKTYPIQFKRQYPLGIYIVDFFCYRAGLVVELDGSQHCTAENAEYDRGRTAFLNSQGLQVLRLSNRDVMSNFSGVCEHIDRQVKERMRD